MWGGMPDVLPIQGAIVALVFLVIAFVKIFILTTIFPLLEFRKDRLTLLKDLTNPFAIVSTFKNILNILD